MGWPLRGGAQAIESRGSCVGLLSRFTPGVPSVGKRQRSRGRGLPGETRRAYRERLRRELPQDPTVQKELESFRRDERKREASTG